MATRKESKAHARPARRTQPSAPRAPAQVPPTEGGGIRRAPVDRAIEIILADAIADGEGFSFGAVGAPRYGKTHLLKAVLDAARTKGVVDRAFIHDVKKAGAIQYDGTRVTSLEQFMANAATLDNEPSIVFNGDDWLAQVPLQDVCEVAKAVHDEDGTPVIVVADEVFKGTNEFGQFLKGEGDAPAFFPLFLREGTSQRISTAWTTQIPQELPTACKVLTRCVAQFHLESLAADAATEKFRLDADGPRVLRSLQRGEFVLFCQGREWDRTIYGPA